MIRPFSGSKRFWPCLLAAAIAACTGRRLPPGTPPPEYEPPIVPAWAQERAEPSPSKGAGNEADAAIPPDGGSAAELSPGSRPEVR